MSARHWAAERTWRALARGTLVWACLALWPGRGHAAYLWIDYHAGPATATSTPATVWSPEMWGWVDLNAASAGVGSVNPLGLGQNAWRITDALPTLPNPAYVTELNSRAAADAVNNGWRYAATARYVTDYGTGPNQGLSAFFGGRAYHLMLDLTAAGDLQATLYDETPRSYQLTSGGSGATAFHRFELRYAPGTAVATFSMDGRAVDTQWNGVALAHANTFQWGNSNQAGANRGVMEFREVTLEIGPFIAGDFNNDGIADGRDFLLWQRGFGTGIDRVGDANNDGRVDGADLALWRLGFGARTGGTAGVPEPRGLVMALIVACGVAHGSPRRPVACPR